jgi:multidrug resistance protein
MTSPQTAGPPAFGTRQYLPLYVVLFLVGTETFLVSPILPIIAGGFHAGLAAAAASVTSYTVVYAVAAPFVGTLCDRYGRRRFILVGTVLFLLGNIACGLSVSLPVLIVSRGLTGLGGATVGPAIWAYIAETCPEATRGRAMGRGMAAFSLGQVAGVPLGAALAQALGWRWSFFAIGIGLALCWPILARVVRATAANTASDLRTVLPSTFTVWGRREVAWALVVTFFLQAASLGAYTYLGADLSGRFGLGTAAVGLVGLLVGGGSVVGSLLGGRLSDRFRAPSPRAVLPLATAAALVAGGAALAFTTPLVAALVGVVAWFVASGMFVASQATMLGVLAAERRAAVMSWNNSVMYAGTAVGTTVIGSTVGGGPGTVLVVVALILLAGITLTGLATRLTAMGRTNAGPVEPSPDAADASPETAADATTEVTR